MVQFPEFPAGPSRHGIGRWEPLPYIHSGLVVYPHRPSTSKALPIPPRRSSLPDVFTGAEHVGGEGAKRTGNPYEVPLEIGDEVFAFEQYHEAGDHNLEKDNVWLRGYIVQARTLASIAPSSSTILPAKVPNPEPSVLIGIFPSTCVHFRQEVSADDGTLPAAYQASLRRSQEDDEKSRSPKIKVEEMAAVNEEEEGQATTIPAVQIANGESIESQSDTVVEIPSLASPVQNKRTSVSGTPRRPKRPTSFMLALAQTEKTEEEKVQPPLPRLSAGDSTIAGQSTPLIDEIACAIREWYTRLPTYLANREYRLFSIVTGHIDALLQGRRQLLNQTMSINELVRIRRECVGRLAKCNVAQGLDVIVRSPEDGSIMVVERERAFGGAKWVSGVACYMYQIQLAYIDLLPLDTLLGKPSTFLPSSNTRASLANARSMRSILSLSATDQDTSTSIRPAYHLLLDVRAFVANPCRPGETAELFFSLYNADENRFITEEFLIVLNHLGSPARDSEQRLGRLRTLFTDLKNEELGPRTFLVCKIVRNGSLKMKNDITTGTYESSVRLSGPSTRRLGTVSETNGLQSTQSIPDSGTDDSFSVTSGFGGHRTNTVETGVTAASILDGRPTYRRPFGCAALPLPTLSKLLVDGNGTEMTLPIFVPKEEAAFATMHEDIIHGRNKDVLVSPRAKGIAVSLSAFHGSPQQIVREHPSLLSGIPLAARLGFADVAGPGEFRNDLYLQLSCATFFSSVSTPASSGGSIRGRKSVLAQIPGTVQVTIEIRRTDGTNITDAIYVGGCGEPPTSCFHSMVFPQIDRPDFSETIKISLPVRAEDCHAFLTIRSRGKDAAIGQETQELELPFAFAFLPLIRESACVQDGPHDLVLYRTDRGQYPAPQVYLDSPAMDANASRASLSSRNHIPLRDRITVQTFLCSTIHTQNDTLRSLFRWQGNLADTAAVTSMLRLLPFVDEDETAHFVPRVCDALLGVLVSNAESEDDELDSLVFDALTKVLLMSADRRYPGFALVLDSYIKRQFNYPAAGSRLLKTIKLVMSRPETKEYRAFIKVWHLFFRFAIRSREIEQQRGSGHDTTSVNDEENIRQGMKDIMDDINALMQSTDKKLIGTQILAVQHYADILPDLAQVFSPLEIAELVISFADTLTQAKGSLASHKLLLLLQVIKSVIDAPEARTVLVPALVRWVKPHLGRYDPGAGVAGESEASRDERKIKWMECNRLAVTIIALTVNKLQESTTSMTGKDGAANSDDDAMEYCFMLIPSLLGSYAEQSSAATAEMLRNHRSVSASVYKSAPDVFPATMPVALLAELPPPSLLENNKALAGDGLPVSKTFVCGAVEITVVLFTMVLSARRQVVLEWLDELHDAEGPEGLSSVLCSLLAFCSRVVKNESYPSQWLTLNLMFLGSIIRLLDPIAEFLKRKCIPMSQHASSFDVPLWTSMFELLCDFCASHELCLEDMGQQRRRAQWIISGDLRDDSAALLLGLWSAIGTGGDDHGEGPRYQGYQMQFTGLNRRVLALCLSSHDALCEAAVEILFSLIHAEYKRNGDFGEIQMAIFAQLDELFSVPSASPSEPASQAYFVTQLRTVSENSPTADDDFHAKIKAFMNDIEHFIDLLLVLRILPENGTWKDERGSASYRLMNFADRIGRTDLYIRYADKLRRLLLVAGDHLGAGYAVKLHADRYDWNLAGQVVGDFEPMGLPAQTEFERKEALLYHAMDHFVEAEAYEAAIQICQDLTHQYQKQTFEIAKLGEMLVHQARLWDKVVKTTRPRPEYFRVAYFGDMDMVNRGGDFVVRGQPWERYSDFCETLQLKHPAATVHRSKIPPPEAMRQGIEPIIWVTSVSPEPDANRPVLREGVAEPIQAYWKANEIKRFSSVRPYARDQATESVFTWTEKTILTTANELPGVLNRSEVIDISYEQISPLMNALIEVERAAKALRSLATDPVDAKQLGTAINGAVDSPVNGGVKLYRTASGTAFLDSDYAQQHPDEAKQVEKLKAALQYYVQTISDVLIVHGIVCRDMVFHEALRSHFQRAFPDEIKALHDSDRSLSSPMPRLSVANGHANGNGPSALNGLGLPEISQRASTFSIGSNAYVLPALRTGPSGPSAPQTPIMSRHASPAQSVHRDAGSVIVTAVSSPRQSYSSRASRVSISTATPPPTGILTNGASSPLVSAGSDMAGEREPRPSVSSRFSMVGSARSNSIRSVSRGEGAETKLQDSVNGSAINGEGGKEKVKNQNGTKKGLKRLSGLVRF